MIGIVHIYLITHTHQKLGSPKRNVKTNIALLQVDV